MPLRHQLRIRDPQDRLKIYDLDQVDGVTTIGQDATNDILLQGAGVAPVQVVLDCRQPPHRLTVPDQAESVTVNDQAVPPGGSCEIQDYSIVQTAVASAPGGVGTAPPAARIQPVWGLTRPSPGKLGPMRLDG